MASAEKTDIKKIVTTTTPGVVLTLDDEEAQVLADLLAKVSGPTSGRRGVRDRIARAMEDVGVKWTYPGIQGIAGTLTVDSSSGIKGVY